MSAGFKVDFLGIGPMKAGTTWVGHMLEGHPQICMAEPKEVHFFNESLSFNQSYSKRHFSLGYKWYAKHFAHCKADAVKGEITPRYLIDPIAAQRIYEHNPDVKLIVCLRNPLDRIVSHYHSARDYHKSEPRTISVAIREQPEYIDACKYYKHITAYLQYFRADQFFYVDMDDVIHQPESVLRSLYLFLGVDPSYRPAKLQEKSNPARTTRSVALRKISGGLHRSLVGIGLSPLILLLKKIGLGKLINRMNSAPLQKVSLSESDQQYIREQLQDDIARFGKLLGRDFSHWLN